MTQNKILLSVMALSVMGLVSCGANDTASPDPAPVKTEKPMPKTVEAQPSAPTAATQAPTTEEALLKRGRIVWFKCRSCHETSLEGPHKVGPNLHALMGATAGQKEGFVYSEVMKESGVIWNEETLDAFIEKPTGFIKGTKMAFVGIKKESDRQAVIAYIKENTKPAE